MQFAYFFFSFLLLASKALSITVHFSSHPVAIEPLRPVFFRCDISNYYPGTANYSVAFYRGHSANNLKSLIGTHDVYTQNNNQHTIIFSAGKFLDSEAHSGQYYSLPRFELRFEPRANLTAYQLYWCELIEQSTKPAPLAHTSNIQSLQPSVNFSMPVRGAPFTATCEVSNFNPATVQEYSVVFYNADSSLSTLRVYHLGTYHARQGAELEFIPDSTQPEVTVHGSRFNFPLFEISVDRRFNNIVYYCALELGPVGSSTGLKYKSNIFHGF